MLPISTELQTQLIDYANSKLPQESCALIVDNKTIAPCKNMAEDPTEDAAIAASAFARASKKGQVTAMFHSHSKEGHGTEFSPTDIRSSKFHKTPYILYHPHFGQWDYYEPGNLNPFPLIDKGDPKSIDFYLGWRWVWNRADCGTLFINYYKGMLGIDVKDVDRSDEPTEFIKRGWNLYEEKLPENGFAKVTGDIRKHDLILMTVWGRNPHHIGIITDPNRNAMLHHFQPPRLSELTVYGGDWLDATVSVWRHKTLA